MYRFSFESCAVLAFILLTTSCNRHVWSEEPTQEPPGTESSDIFLEPDSRVITGVVPRRSTLASLFTDHGLGSRLGARLIETIRPVFDPRRIRAGNQYSFVIADDGLLRRFEYHIDNDHFLQAVLKSHSSLSFDVELVAYTKETLELAVKGSINAQNSSLVAALNGSGENVILGIMMAEVLSGEIDFNNDLRQGDQFNVLFEKQFREGEFAGYGDVIATEFVNDDRLVQAFRYVLPKDNEVLYYDEQGRSLKRLFLRSPFRFEPRVTSRFSYRRLHPVLGVHRPHLGVDYGAPTGTPVIAVASGRVVSAGRSGGAGNMVRLRHTNGYETYYLHLSAFGKGVVAGARITQGQEIGKVGNTGLSTGPHLDYRMRKNGTFVNPLLEHRKLPPGDPVPEEYLADFFAIRDQARLRMHSSISTSEKIGLTN